MLQAFATNLLLIGHGMYLILITIIGKMVGVTMIVAIQISQSLELSMECGCSLIQADDYWNEDWSNNILHWGCRYARNQIDELRAKCGDGTAIAATIGGDRIELYLGFFYSKNLPGRAETLMHESRHMGGKSHNANFPSGSVFGAGKSGADSDGIIMGRGCLLLYIFGGFTQMDMVRHPLFGKL